MLQLIPKEKSAKRHDRTITNDRTLVTKSNPKTYDWIEKYQPKSLDDLKIHHTKVKALRSWLQAAKEHNSQLQYPPILVLFGVSGSGKSKAVELMCREMEIDVSHWTEDLWESENTNKTSLFGRITNTTCSDIRNEHFNKRKDTSAGNNFHSETSFVSDLFQIDNENAFQSYGKSKQSQWEEFSRQIRYPSLSLTAKGSSCLPSSSSSKQNTNNPFPTVVPYKIVTKQNPKKNHHNTYHIAVEEDDITVIDSDDEENDDDHSISRILLIHDAAFLTSSFSSSYGDYENQLRKQDLKLKAFESLLGMQLPIVVTMSDAINREDQFTLVQQFLPASYRSLIAIEWIYWPPITDMKLMKLLTTIRKNEGLSPGVFTEEVLHHIVLSSQGDIRHAILELQFQATVQQASSSSLSIRSKQIITATTNSYSKSNNSNERTETIDLTQDEDWVNDNDANENMMLLSHNTKRLKHTHYTPSSFSTMIGTQSQPLPPSQSSSSSSSHKHNLIERDTTFSTMHGLGKLLHYKLNHKGYLDNGSSDYLDLDEIINRAELTPEYLMTMLQYNAIENISGQLSVAEIGGNDDADCGGYDDPLANAMMAFDAVVQALEQFSDCDLFQSKKYDPSVQLDRGQVDTSSLLSSSGSGFPEQYITSLGGRTLLVAKGSGLKEKMERVKAIGYTGGSGGFHGVKGPQLQKLRAERNIKYHTIQSMKEKALQDSISRYEEGLSCEDIVIDDMNTSYQTRRSGIPTHLSMHNSHNASTTTCCSNASLIHWIVDIYPFTAPATMSSSRHSHSSHHVNSIRTDATHFEMRNDGICSSFADRREEDNFFTIEEF